MAETGEEEAGARKVGMEKLGLLSETTEMLGFPSHSESKPQKAGKQTLQIGLKLCQSKMTVTFTRTVMVVTHRTTDQHSTALFPFLLQLTY